MYLTHARYQGVSVQSTMPCNALFFARLFCSHAMFRAYQACLKQQWCMLLTVYPVVSTRSCGEVLLLAAGTAGRNSRG